jgi:flagellar hook assembly protein FlgD
VRIFNIRGRPTRKLCTKKDGDAYVRRIYWDGKNDRGDEVASGLYYYMMEIPARGEKTGETYIYALIIQKFWIASY